MLGEQVRARPFGGRECLLLASQPLTQEGAFDPYREWRLLIKSPSCLNPLAVDEASGR